MKTTIYEKLAIVMSAAILAWALCVTYRTISEATMVESANSVMIGDMKVSEPYFRRNGANAKVGAVFFELTNMSNGADRLISASTDIARMTELHEHVETGDGIMQMREIKGGIAIPAGQTHLLKRGGDHVMLMGLKPNLSDGTAFKLRLEFEKAGTGEVELMIKPQNTAQ